MKGVSVYLEGTWTPTDFPDAAPTPFTLNTSVAHALLPHVEEVLDGDLNTASTDATIVIERRVDTLFEGADFENMSAVQIERNLLSNLMRDASVHLSLER